jgi:hypothetical protein
MTAATEQDVVVSMMSPQFRCMRAEDGNAEDLGCKRVGYIRKGAHLSGDDLVTE